MKASKYVARVRCERRGISYGPKPSLGEGATRDEAQKALLADIATQVVFDAVLPGDIVVPAEFAEQIPDRMPDFYGLLILEIGNVKGRDTEWDWAAVPIGKFRLLNVWDYVNGKVRVDAKLVASGKPVRHGVVDCNDDSTVLRLPDRSLKFRNGAWVPWRNIGADWGDAPAQGAVGVDAHD